MNSSNSPQHLDPLASILAAAPLDDEPVTESEAKAIAEGKRDVAAGRVVSAAEVHASFGLPAAGHVRKRLGWFTRRLAHPIAAPGNRAKAAP